MGLENKKKHEQPKTVKVKEMIAVFDSSDALEKAAEDLQQKGFDRADFSMLASEETIKNKLGHMYEKVDHLEDHDKVPRMRFITPGDIHKEESALVGAMFVIGAAAGSLAVLASGGTLGVLLATAAASGAGGAGFAELAAKAFGWTYAKNLEQQLEKGGILFWVRCRNPMKQGIVKNALEEAGGRDVHLHEIERPWGDDDILLHDFNPDKLLPPEA
jgi:hypothetical protein